MIFGEDQDMPNRTRPAAATLLAAFALLGALLTGYFGLSAYGYLVPAATMLVAALLLWLGRLGRLVKAMAVVNLASGVVLVLVLAFGDSLGDRKLDISGVSLLLNLLAGGPLLGLLAAPILWALRRGHKLAVWFAPATASA